MHVAFYSDPFAKQHAFGTARYSRQLYEALLRTDRDLRLTPVSAWTDRDAEGVARLQRAYDYRRLPWGRKFTAMAWAFLNYPPLEHWLRSEFNLVHMLEVMYPLATRKPVVATIHDLGPLTHPGFFSKSHPWLVAKGLRRLERSGAAIICVSQATADDLQEWLRCDLGERLHVIHEGVTPLFFGQSHPFCLQEMKAFPSPHVPFILTAGAISPRKNIVRVIEALEQLRDTIPHHLVHAGEVFWDGDAVFERLKRSPIADRVHFPGYVTDEQLHALFQRASVFAYPSLFEGFGLPVVEAFAAGCPVITSNRSSLPEVAGDAAQLVDPTDTRAIAEALQGICSDDGLAEELRKKGKKRASRLRWEQCASEVAAIYRKMLGHTSTPPTGDLGAA